MSYILEALKKSEQERHIGQVPDITVMQEPTPTHGSRWPWLILVALVVNVLVIAAVAWRPWDKTPSVPQVAPTTQDRTGGPAGAESGPDAVPEPAPSPPPVVTAPEPVFSEPMVIESPPPVATRAPVQEDVVRWEDLSVEERSRLPVPRIDVHVFASDPGRRFILVNLRKYQEGDMLEQGVKLDAIGAEGIVLSYQGQRYQVDRP